MAGARGDGGRGKGIIVGVLSGIKAGLSFLSEVGVETSQETDK